MLFYLLCTLDWVVGSETLAGLEQIRGLTKKTSNKQSHSTRQPRSVQCAAAGRLLDVLPSDARRLTSVAAVEDSVDDPNHFSSRARCLSSDSCLPCPIDPTSDEAERPMVAAVSKGLLLAKSTESITSSSFTRRKLLQACAQFLLWRIA